MTFLAGEGPILSTAGLSQDLSAGPTSGPQVFSGPCPRRHKPRSLAGRPGTGTVSVGTAGTVSAVRGGLCSAARPRGIQTGTPSRWEQTRSPRSLTRATHIHARCRRLCPQTPAPSAEDPVLALSQRPAGQPVSASKAGGSSHPSFRVSGSPSAPRPRQPGPWMPKPHPAGARRLQSPAGWGASCRRGCSHLHQRVFWWPGLVSGDEGQLRTGQTYFSRECSLWRLHSGSRQSSLSL